MKVLVITGDRGFGPGNPRYELQRSAVDELVVVYWGRGSVWPRIPKGNFDVVTAQDPFGRGFFAWRAARRLNAKFNVQVHADLRGQSFMKHILAQIVLRHADSIRVVSEKIKQQIERIVVSAPILVLPVFIDLEAVKNAPAADLKKEFSQFSKIILWVGRLEPEKNCAGALNIFAEVLKAVPDAGLLIAGEGSERKMLEQRARNFGIEKSVIFLGHRADIFSLYKAANVLLVTSRFESYGAALVEALAAGVPVVAPDVGVAIEAGARVVPRGQLAEEVAEVLQSEARGELKISLLSKGAWAQKWKETV